MANKSVAEKSKGFTLVPGQRYTLVLSKNGKLRKCEFLYQNSFGYLQFDKTLKPTMYNGREQYLKVRISKKPEWIQQYIEEVAEVAPVKA